MAKRNEGEMPAEQGIRDRSRGVMDDRTRESGNEEDVRGIGDTDDEFEDMEEVEDTEEDDEEEGSF